MTVTLIEGIAAVLMYMFGGALVLFTYEAYVKTRQKNLMHMAIGFFTLIFGGNLTTLVEAVQGQTWWPTAFDASDTRAFSLVIQLIGIVILLLSAMRPFGRKE